MAIIGLRQIVPSIDLFPVNKIFCKFDISGDSKHPVLTNKHAVFSGSADVLEIITIDVDVPVDLQYSPTLTVYVYDNITGLGAIGDRLVGVASIPLYPYCSRVIEQLNSVSHILQDNLNSMMRGKTSHSMHRAKELIHKDKMFIHKLALQQKAEQSIGDDDH